MFWMECNLPVYLNHRCQYLQYILCVQGYIKFIFSAYEDFEFII